MKNGGAIDSLLNSQYLSIILILIILNTSTHVSITGASESSNPNSTPLQETYSKPSIDDVQLPTQYTDSNPISFTANSDFSNFGLAGEGTQDNPYIISGLLFKEFSLGTAIVISDTDVFFHIMDNIFEEVSVGIILENVKNGRISDNTFANVEFVAIIISHSSTLNVVESNKISGGEGGIEIRESSSNNQIVSNEIKQNFISGNSLINGVVGINIFDESGYTIITNNYIEGMVNVGINLDGLNFVHLLSNEIYNCASFGIYSISISKLVILNNQIHNTGSHAIWIGNSNEAIIDNNNIQNTNSVNLYYSGFSIISNNHITGSEDQSVLLEDSDQNLIIHNTFDDSNVGLELLFEAPDVSNDNIVMMNSFLTGNPILDIAALDHGHNNTFENNYWSTFTEPDNDNDGTVDNPKSIVGDAENYDYSPSVELENPNWDHILFDKTHSWGIDVQVFQDVALVLWSPTIDSHNHELWYNLSYSFSGESWSHGGYSRETFAYLDIIQLDRFSNLVIQIQVSHGVSLIPTPTDIVNTQLELFTSDNKSRILIALLVTGIIFIIGIIYRKRTNVCF
ncbi:MAG: right-handed parallel beta-helix repeat-containing protein [Candidatus Kariarchaeaceae archaeon]|jgi:parallel beta-helix repeat protein